MSQNLCRDHGVTTCLLLHPSVIAHKIIGLSTFDIKKNKQNKPCLPTMKKPLFIYISHLHLSLFVYVLWFNACATFPSDDNFFLPFILVHVTVAKAWNVQETFAQATFTLLGARRGTSPVWELFLGPSDPPDVWCSIWKTRYFPGQGEGVIENGEKAIYVCVHRDIQISSVIIRAIYNRDSSKF